MKKLLIILSLLLALCGCQEDGKQIADPDERYMYIIEMINEHESFQEASNYFDISGEMAKIENCVDCGLCKSKCPYGLDTPNLLRKNLQDYKEILAGKEV